MELTGSGRETLPLPLLYFFICMSHQGDGRADDRRGTINYRATFTRTTPADLGLSIEPKPKFPTRTRTQARTRIPLPHHSTAFNEQYHHRSICIVHHQRSKQRPNDIDQICVEQYQRSTNNDQRPTANDEKSTPCSSKSTTCV